MEENDKAKVVIHILDYRERKIIEAKINYTKKLIAKEEDKKDANEEYIAKQRYNIEYYEGVLDDDS